MDAASAAEFVAALTVGAAAGAMGVRALAAARRVVADAEYDLLVHRLLDDRDDVPALVGPGAAALN